MKFTDKEVQTMYIEWFNNYLTTDKGRKLNK